MTADSLTYQDAARQLQGMGPEGMLADLGPNLRQQAGGLASLPGAGQKTVRDAFSGRAAGASGRITGAVDSTLGPSRNVTAMAEDIITRRSKDAAPAYAAALSQPVQPSEWLLGALNDPIMQKGLAKGMRIQRLEALAKGEKFDPTDYAVTAFNEAGDPIISGVPNMRTLDVIKKGLDELVDDSKNIVTGRLNQEGNAINSLRRSFLRDLDAMNPLYAGARRVWEGPTRVHSALQEGQEVFRRTVSPDELRSQIGKMNVSEKEAFQQGARAQVAEMMGTARNDAGTAWRELADKGWNREKLDILLGPGAADKLIGALRTEKSFQDTATRVAQNSETAARVASQSELGNPQFGLREGYMAGGVMGGARAAGVRSVEKVANAIGSRSQGKAREELAKLLTATGSERDAIITRLSSGRNPSDWSRVSEAAKNQALIQALMAPRLFASGLPDEYR
jgi:hypothetical protein